MTCFRILVIVLVFVNLTFVNGSEVYLYCDEFNRPEEQDIYCTITGLNVVHGQELKVQTYANHKTNSIKTMTFYGSTVLYIPYKLFEVYQKLTSLDISYCGILDITRNSFAGAASLTYLNMSHNNLTELSTSVFVGANSLLLIDLSGNLIRVISENALKGLQILNRIVLSSNLLTKLHKDIFVDNINLQAVVVDNNLIETLDPDIFSRLTRLREVNFVNNRLTVIDPQLFKNCFNMDSVRFSGNGLKNFEVLFANPLYTLELNNNKLESLVLNGTKTLSATNNSISSIKFLSPNFVERLSLSKNRIKDLSNITLCRNVTDLNLSFNTIGQINTKTFANFTRLKRLNLTHANVSGLNYGTFSKQTGLEVLDLSYNNLTRINLDTFIPYLSRINEFYIDGNNLTEINGKILFAYAFPMLSTLGISNNNFNCSYLLMLLSPLALQNKVKLHYGPENAQEAASTHVRGIACRSTDHHSQDVTVIPHELTPLEKLQAHERQLEQHLILMKWFIGGMAIVALSFVLYKLIQLAKRRHQPLVRNIMFRSTATVNTLQTAIDS